MARIKNKQKYPIKNKPVEGDTVIGTNSEDNGKTVNFPINVLGSVDGLSAYEIALNNGFVGTEAEWLASLQGADGQDGGGIILEEFETISEMRAFNGVIQEKGLYYLKGYYDINDGGQGFFYGETSSDDDDNGMIIKPTSITNERFKRFYSAEIDMNWYGLVSYNASSSAYNRTCIINALNFISSTNFAGTLYLPAGNYFCDPINEDNDPVDFRYVSWRGDGMRRSILTLSSGSTESLIDVNTLFEVSFKDLQFNGNRTNCPDSPSTVKIYNANSYNILFENVYFRDSENIGLHLEQGQHFTLNHVAAKNHSGVGIKLERCVNVSLFHPDIEQISTGTGLLIESASVTQYRYFNPQIRVYNPYLENCQTGIHLKGVCGVVIEHIYDNDRNALKISKNDSGDPSCFNVVKGNSDGHILIEEGNYGNHIEAPYIVESNYIEDLDGRNSIGSENTFLKWDWVNNSNFKEGVVNNSFDTNLGAIVVSDGVGNSSSTLSESIFNDAISHDSALGGVSCKSIICSGINSSSFSVNYSGIYKQNTSFYFNMIYRALGSCLHTISVYDNLNADYYNFVNKTWQDTIDDDCRMRIGSGKGLKGVEIEILTDSNDRNFIVTNSLNATGSNNQEYRFYYALITEIENSGVIHYKDNKLIGFGNKCFLETVDLPPADEVSIYTEVYDTTINRTIFSDSINWIDGAAGAASGADGSVQFSDSGSNNSDEDFFWDNSTKRLGVGTNVPESNLHVQGTTKLNGNVTGNGDVTFVKGSGTGRLRMAKDSNFAELAASSSFPIFNFGNLGGGNRTLDIQHNSTRVGQLSHLGKLTMNDLALLSLPEYVDDVSAASLNSGDLYKTPTGEIRIKL